MLTAYCSMRKYIYLCYTMIYSLFSVWKCMIGFTYLSSTLVSTSINLKYLFEFFLHTFTFQRNILVSQISVTGNITSIIPTRTRISMMVLSIIVCSAEEKFLYFLFFFFLRSSQQTLHQQTYNIRIQIIF